MLLYSPAIDPVWNDRRSGMMAVSFCERSGRFYPLQVKLAKEISVDIIPAVMLVCVDEMVNFTQRYKGKEP